jgi:hypothetical protein
MKGFARFKIPFGDPGFYECKNLEKRAKQTVLIPSSMGHVESRVNQRGPPRKAKYS